MAQQLTALSAFSKDPGLVPSTHTGASQQSVTPVPRIRYLLLTSEGAGTMMHRQNQYPLNKILKIF